MGSVLSVNRNERRLNMRILVLNGSPRSKGNTKQMVEAFRAGAEAAGHQGDFLDYLGLEDMGVFTAHGSENGSAAKLGELKNFGASLSCTTHKKEIKLY